ncbi:exocyst complex subunit 4 [Tieghemostelium lacteum]|uniref:Exocyst complex component Sec8 n=1 Tax=Tieghemostelium lacteum TaxID=361077 RepID=A0A152A5H3_TIELA|nr:exocyst complex subunit 4 [Tieghemostelium lacteum]|eukprot:KYR01483.1 exocyst complex subunit 4 [Tieghemostelium lacteum]
MEEDDQPKRLDEERISRILSNIPEQYHKPSFQARKTALDYMRSSDRKNLLTQIENWVDDINGVTDQIVEVYFQGFNKSIHNYSRILEFMGDSHSNALSMGKEVEEINKLIFFNNLGIERLWRRNLEQYYMIQILEKMEELKLVPDLLNRYIDGNHFVHSSNLLVNSLNALSEKELINVNALKDLRQSLTEKKEEFKDIIIDKLNDHIYLKTEQSVKMSEDEENIDDFNSNLKKLVDDNHNISANSSSLSSPTISNSKSSSPFINGQSTTSTTTSLKSPNVQSLNNNNNKNVGSGVGKTKNKNHELLKLEEISKQSIGIEDLNLNPETNGRLFMNLLVESLNVLEYLHPAVGLILGKISIELKSIIQSCSSTVTQLYLSEGRKVARIPGESTPLGSSSNGISQPGSGNSNSGGGGGGVSYHSAYDDQMSINILSDNFNRNDLLTNNGNNNIPLVDLLSLIFKKVTKVFKNHLFLSKIFNEAIDQAESRERSNQFDFKSTAELEMEEDQVGTDGLPLIKSPKLSKKSDTHQVVDIYSDYLVWEIIQKELREMLRVHLHDTSSLLLSTSSNVNNLSGDNHSSTTKSNTKLFSFSNSIVTDSWNGSTSPILTSSPSNLGGGGAGSGISPLSTSTGINSGGAVGIFKASQYNVTSVYPQIIQFTDQIDAILEEKKAKEQKLHPGSPQLNSTGSKILRLYIDDFVHLNFLQHIKNDYKERITQSVEATDAFKPLERYKLVFKLRETKPILNSALQIFQFVSELFQDIVAMPQYVVEFGAIIQNCLLRYYEKCRSKFYQELEPTLTNQLLNTDLFKYLITALDRVERKQEPPIKFQDSREEEFEYKLQAELFQNHEKPVQKSQLILDIEKLTMIANINHSLEWLADKVSQLFLQNDLDHHHSTPTKTQNLKTPSKNIGGGSGVGKNTPKLPSQKHNLLSPETIEALSDLNLSGVVKDYKDLARRCLLSLRVEYRIHCFYFLEGFKKASYLCDEERADQDTFIVELNKDLSKNEETMSIYLTADKCQFLFGGIAKLIGKLLIAKLVHIKQINTNGVSKLCKNVFTLQQNLSNIIVKREIFFDRVRQFYQSLLVEDEFLNYIVEKLAQPYFSLEEGKIILDFLITTKRISANALQTVEAKYKTMLQPDNDKNKL